MGKIGESIRKQMGLLDEESSQPEAKQETKKEEAKSKIMAFGIKSELDKNGKPVYTCVEINLVNDKLDSVKSLSHSPRQNKMLVLEDWKLNTGKFILNRDKW